MLSCSRLSKSFVCQPIKGSPRADVSSFLTRVVSFPREEGNSGSVRRLIKGDLRISLLPCITKFNRYGDFHLSVESNSRLFWICITTLSVWFKNHAPLSQPIRSKTKTSHESLAHIFPRFGFVLLPSVIGLKTRAIFSATLNHSCVYHVCGFMCTRVT